MSGIVTALVQLAAGLDHPNITTVYDFQVEDGIPYIVMEYIPDALDRHLQGGTRLPWERATEIAVQIARDPGLISYV